MIQNLRCLFRPWVAFAYPCCPRSHRVTKVTRLAPTVFARQLGGADKPTLTTITPDWLRFDITLAPASDPRPHGYAAKPLFRRDTRAVPFAFTPPTPQASRDRLPALVGDFLRVLALLPVAVGRGELLAGLTPAMLLRGYLIDLYLLESGRPRGGAKRLDALLTAGQRRALEELPPLAPTRAAIIAGHVAAARLFPPHARQLAAAHEQPYPAKFEEATLAHLHRSLGTVL